MKKILTSTFTAIGYAASYMFFQGIVSVIYAVAGTIQYVLRAESDPQFALYFGSPETYSAAFLYANQWIIQMMSCILTAILLIVIALLRHNSLSKRFCLRMPARSESIIYAIPFGLTLNPIVSFVIGLLPAAWVADYDAASALVEEGPIWAAFFGMVVAAPLLEEILFRGAIYGTLRKIMPAGWAVVLQGILFGLLHGQAVWIVYAAVLGILFGVLRVRYRSIWVSVAAHAAFNLFSFALMLLPETVFDVHPLALVVLLTVSAAAVLLLGYQLLLRPRDEGFAASYEGPLFY